MIGPETIPPSVVFFFPPSEAAENRDNVTRRLN